MEISTRTAALTEWTERLAEPAPAPGGGAAAAVVAAIGAAVAAMADGYGDDHPDARRFVAARERAWKVADDDAAASADLAVVFHAAPEDRDADRTRRILEHAAVSSAAVADVVVELASALEPLAKRCPEPVRADVAVAARLLAAGARAGAVNVRVNATASADAGSSAEFVADLRAKEQDAIAAADALDRLAAEVTDTL